MPTVRMAEKLRISEFHMLEVEVTYSDDDVALVAEEAGITAEEAGSSLIAYEKTIELVLYEERKILVAAAVRSGLLDLDTAKTILQAWRPT